MKYKSTLLMAMILAVLCAGYWGMLRREEDVARKVVEAKRFFSVEAKDVIALEIDRFDQDPNAARRNTNGSWTFVKPDATVVALQELWERVATAFAELKNERTISEDMENLADYGLEEPALVVTAEMTEGSKHVLHIGSTEPTKVHRFAQLDGGPVFLIAGPAFYELNRSLNELRDRFLIDDRDAAILWFEFARIWTGLEKTKAENPPAPGEESVQVTLKRENAESPWVMLSPYEAPANQELVEVLVAEVQFGI